MIINNFFTLFGDLFYDQPFSNSYFDKINSLSFQNQYNFFHYCYNILLNEEYSKYAAECEKKNTLSIEEAKKYKDYNDLLKLFERFLDVYRRIIESGLSVNQYFKLNKHKFMQYRTFYETKKKFLKHLAKCSVNFENIFYGSRRPLNCKYKYDQRHRTMIKEYVTFKFEESMDNLTNIWIKLCKDEEIAKEYDFSKLAYNTLIKIFYQEKGIFRLTKKQFRTPHVFRTTVRKPGNVQADVKVYGKLETSVGKKVRVFVVKDIATRLTYTKTLIRETSKEIVEALEESRLWFQTFGIRILSIQTDNAMVFKKTNFVYSNEYHTWCEANKIKARHIRLRHPESNGNVERTNGIMDFEWHHFLIGCKTVEEVDAVVKTMTQHFNFNRYMIFGELKNPKYEISSRDRYLIPAQSVQLINDLYNKFEKDRK